MKNILQDFPLALCLSGTFLSGVSCEDHAGSNTGSDHLTGEKAAVEAAAEPGIPAWTVFRGAPDLTGVVDAKITLPLELRWQVKTEDPILASPVSDGEHVFIGDGDGNFLCLALKDGAEIWRAKIDATIEGTACIIGDLVVVGGTDGFVYAYEKKSGTQAWKFETLGEIVGGINTFTRQAADGNVPCAVFGSHDNKLYCIDACDGTEQWSVETGYYVNGTPSVAGDKISFGGCDGFIYINNAQTGEEVGKFELGSYISNSIIIKNDTAYVAHYDNRVEAYSIADGKKIWSFEERSFPYYASPAVTESMVIAPGQGKRVYAIDRKTGEEVWNFRTAGSSDSSPVVAGGYVIFGADDGILYFLNEKTGEEAWRYEIGDEIKSSPALVRDSLIIGASDGRVYAFTIPEASMPTK
ncbi:MAG: PQQ-binding-like beta-propeller repeat protein [Verrucomicrobiae bacterium]|nr:PQQ-binding-like beta-propeller repeat protein [Verrucomicrobiae bacterium]